MLDDFFIRALLAGVGVALAAGPLGCFVVWRRMAYFGDTLAHAALLGAGLSLLSGANMVLVVFFLSVAIALALLALQRHSLLPYDALLGLLSHSALALGLVVLSLMTWLRFDVMGLLFGDILSVTRMDLLVIYGGGAAVLAILARIWSPLLATTVDPDLAAAEGYNTQLATFVFTLLLAAVIAIAIKVVGVLLITALLIVPAAAARSFATSPEFMAASAATIGVISVIGGLFTSLHWDTPAGPTIVVAAALIFVVLLTPLTRVFAGRFRR